ncbi:MAG: Coq4 family protein [Nannocystaceae bacterium]
MFSKVIQATRFIRAYTTLVRDPKKTERVFQLINSMGDEGLTKLPGFMERPEVQQVMSKPAKRLDTNLEMLAALPEGTLGRCFAEYMQAQGFDPAGLVYNTGDSPFDRIRIHLEATHDVWHVVTGFRTDVAGELGLQAFYHAQFGAGLALILISSGLLNTLFFALDDADRRMAAISHGWQLGRTARPLLGVDWSTRWDQPLAHVRRDLGLSETGEGFERHLAKVA